MSNSPREYIEPQTLQHMYRYDSFRKATGLNYKALYRKHTQAVAEVDKAKGELGGLANQAYMIINPVLFAYLTDIALEYLALGAEMYGEISENKIV